MDYELLIQQTNQLIKACEQAQARFFHMREIDREPNFFEEVKPYADDMRAQIEQWRVQVYTFIDTEQPKYMHKVQIDNAIDAMEQFFVQSFYKATSKKRFLQSIQAVQYTLDTLLRKIGAEQ